MMYKRYEGSFLSVAGVSWTCQIWQEAQSAFASVGELDFPKDSPLVIEWPETAKEDVICGSTATLTVISPSDRSFLDLYTIRPGTIRLDVYRNSVLYWSGALDPEHAEEPYSSGSGYDVTLTFSDFGILRRLSYNLTGTKTFLQILEDALSRSAVNYASLDQSMISTYIRSSSNRATLDKLAVRSENFYDEDGAPMTLYDAVAGILRPLSLRLVQKSGKIYVYDLNGMMASGPSRIISWGSSDQMISVDKVYNDVTVVFSAYSGGELFPEFIYTGDYSKDKINLANTAPAPYLGYECYTYYPDYRSSPAWDYSNLAFSIFLSDEADGLAGKYSYARYFHIEPILSGEEHDGVALWFYTGGHGSLASGRPVRKCASSAPSSSAEVLRTNRIYLPPLPSSARGKYRIRIEQDMLIDARYNPFTDASKNNESGNQGNLKTYTLVTLPVAIQLYDASGNVTHHYSNRAVRQLSSPSSFLALDDLIGEWKSGAYANDCVFHYQRWFSDGEFNTPLVGFMGNQQAMNFMQCLASASVKSLEAGQYIPYPPQGGYIEISVRAGVKFLNNAHLYVGSLSDETLGTDLSSVSNLRWVLFDAPKVELVHSDLLTSALEDDDVEYSGVINPDAEESLSLDEIVGSMEVPVPTARGLMLNASTQQPISTLSRAGRTASPEQLLIGTLFSQYADRHYRLTGTMLHEGGGLGLLTDTNLPGKVLLPLSEVEDLIMDESETSAVELSADNYIASGDE